MKKINVSDATYICLLLDEYAAITGRYPDECRVEIIKGHWARAEDLLERHADQRDGSFRKLRQADMNLRERLGMTEDEVTWETWAPLT